jgi:hypothetical protein
MTNHGTTKPKRRHRQDVWNDAEVIAWIARRTEKAVTAAGPVVTLIEKNNAARPEEKKPLSVASALIAFDASENIHAADENEPPSIGELCAGAESEFESALEEERLIRRHDGHFDARTVRQLWPGRGRGNAEKLYLASADVGALESSIRRSSGVTRAAHMKLAGIEYTSKKKQKAAYLAAIKSAGCNLSVNLPALAWEALERIGPTLSQQAQDHLEQTAFGRILTAREREILVSGDKGHEIAKRLLWLHEKVQEARLGQLDRVNKARVKVGFPEER